tara:strand:+ start:93 stop:521 length:429 start_codon:yes stop_codon:yes gene_type:complete
MKKPKKKTMTLLEVMIVIFIIGIIGSVIGYNMRGSLDEGKAFKTKEAISKLYEISQLVWDDKNQVSDDPGRIKTMLFDSRLVRRPNALMQDGWQQPFEFYIDEGSSELRIISKKYEEYYDKKRKENPSSDSKSNEYGYPWEQ